MYVIARGQYDRLQRWVNDCLARYYEFKYGETEDGKPKIGRLQLSMRPIQLYEVVFPSEHLNKVIALLQPYGGYGFRSGFKKKIVTFLRKVLKLKPIPKGIPKDPTMFHDFVDCMGIGIKEDKWCEEKKREDI